jgi:hypothetical protein
MRDINQIMGPLIVRIRLRITNQPQLFIHYLGTLYWATFYVLSNTAGLYIHYYLFLRENGI